MSGVEINTMEVDQGQVDDSVLQRITNSQKWKTLMKLKDFCLAGWMLADIVLDILSCIGFYRKAQVSLQKYQYLFNDNNDISSNLLNLIIPAFRQIRLVVDTFFVASLFLAYHRVSL